MLYLNKYLIFTAFFSLFLGPMFNGEGGPTIVIFEELKKHLEAHKRKAQVLTDLKRILSFYKIQLGIRDATERHKSASAAAKK